MLILRIEKFIYKFIFRHPNVIAYKEAFFDESSSTLCIVMEFADGGDLY